MKNLINNILANFDVRLERKSWHDKLVSNANKFRDYELSELLNKAYFVNYCEN